MGEKEGTQRGDIPPEREGKRMNHEPDARTRCFENWKWRTAALLCIHLDGHRQLAVGLEQTGAQHGVTGGCLFFLRRLWHDLNFF